MDPDASMLSSRDAFVMHLCVFFMFIKIAWPDIDQAL